MNTHTQEQVNLINELSIKLLETALKTAEQENIAESVAAEDRMGSYAIQASTKFRTVKEIIESLEKVLEYKDKLQNQKISKWL